MLEWLLVFAGVNLALGAVVALLPLVHHKRISRRRRLTLAGVPILWAVLMVGAYVYLLATIPPSPVVGVGLDGRRLLSHGNWVWNVWEERVGTASFEAFCLTVATLISEIILWQAYTIRARRRHARFA